MSPAMAAGITDTPWSLDDIAANMNAMASGTESARTLQALHFKVRHHLTLPSMNDSYPLARADLSVRIDALLDHMARKR